MPMKLEQTLTLCDDGEEPTGILLVGDFQYLTDDQLRWLAAEHIHREQGEGPEDALDEVRGREVERGLWRWAPAPKGSANDTIIQKVDPNQKPDVLMHLQAFQAVQVTVG